MNHDESILDSWRSESMKQLKIRGYEVEHDLRLSRLARAEGISLNQAALRLLRKGAGIPEPGEAAGEIGPALDDFIGTWTDEEADEVERATKDFERIDRKLWK